MIRKQSVQLVIAFAIAVSFTVSPASAARTCQGNICIDVRDDISNPVAVHFHLIFRSLRFTHFNYIHNGAQREIGGGGDVEYRSPLLNVPRQPNNRISVQACNRGGPFSVGSSCTAWVQFALPDLPTTAGPNKLSGGSSGAAKAIDSALRKPIPDTSISPDSARLGGAGGQPTQSSGGSSNQLHSGPATCKQGFVWRVARADDLVCVPPESRSRVALENATAAQNWLTGTRVCRPGLVRRDAFGGDDVCVSVAARTLARAENRDGPSRRVQP